ncbi:MAG: polysaccharide deacetylase family protein [Bacilli bacterium]
MKAKLRIDRIVILIISILLLIVLINLIIPNKIFTIKNFVGNNINTIEKYTKKHNLKLDIKYSYDEKYDKDIIIDQDIKDTKVEKGDTIKITVSKGKIDEKILKYNEVNELGRVPIMMYHGIHNVKSEDTAYTGGNVDAEGYNRTSEAFKADLDMYYEKGYRVIRLEDYVNGKIDVELGKSPIIITFDDGLVNSIKIEGEDEKGLIIDSNSAVGIMEEYKKKYPDMNITATFFINGTLFNQDDYNDKIMKWLIENNYDIGNHTYNHDNFSNTSIEKTQETIAKLYQKLDNIIPNQYVNIIALPYGSPFVTTHVNFPYILKGSYDDYEYENIATLRVGWLPEASPFNIDFDKTFLKRVRAWDNNGENFDIKYTFDNLEKNRFISDGRSDVIVYPKSLNDKFNTNITDKIIFTYDNID